MCLLAVTAFYRLLTMFVIGWPCLPAVTAIYRLITGFLPAECIYRLLPRFTGCLPVFYWLITCVSYWLNTFTGCYRFLLADYLFFTG